MRTMVENASNLDEALAEATATVVSPGGEVKVTVGLGGGLQDLVLTSKAQGMTPKALSAIIKETYDQAAIAAGDKSTSALASVFGDDSEIVRRARAARPEQE
ncbi:MAG TPA: YbaB/EbfC family nucleoid-associated protein [Glycomyces sp.]|nr:YbaB/EbfC family nucleoid-associated protein [Glycomyces sp.]